MQVKLISVTKGTEPVVGPMSGMNDVLDAEELIAYSARVSNPSNQNNRESAAKLLGYLIRHHHWSPFEMASMTIEIQTSRGIAPQILRHRSFSFQEFSLRYAEAAEPEYYEARRQDDKNRQNSIDDMSEMTKTRFRAAQEKIWDACYHEYKNAIESGIAKEQARFLLPLSTKTTLYMSGSIRSWIHYLQVRTEPGVQKEHRDIALAIREIFIQNFPATSTALEWA